MNAWQALLAADRAVFLFVHETLSNPLFDAVLPLLRERLLWAPFYLFLLSFTWFNFRALFARVVLGIALCIALADFTSSTLIKKNVQRLRPCNDPSLEHVVRERITCGSGYSFTSSHAANHMAAAVFLIGVYGRLRRWIRPALLAWAGSIALAQVYVGVHYPADVLGGAGLGWGVGWLVLKLNGKYFEIRNSTFGVRN